MNKLLLFIFLLNILNLNAQIIYTNMDPYSIVTSGNYYNSDTIDISTSHICLVILQTYNSPYLTVTLKAVIDENTDILLNPDNNQVDALVWESEINQGANWSTNNSIPTEYEMISSCNMSDCNQPWAHAQSRFIGYRFYQGEDTLYGWIRISFNTSNMSSVIRIHDFAYNSVSTEGILTGKGIPFSASNLIAVDFADYKDERDIWLRFSIPKIEWSISEYRVFIVPSVISEDFGLEQAEGIIQGNYMSIAPTVSNFSGMIQGGTKDIEGNNVTELIPYKIFILSINSFMTLAQNELSLPSNEITLGTHSPGISNPAVETEYLGGIDYNIKIDFDKPNNIAGLSEYRLMFIDYNEGFEIDADSASEIQAGNYTAITVGGGHYSSIFNKADVIDIHGDNLELNKAYTFCVLSVASGNPFNVNTLVIADTTFKMTNFCDTAKIISAIVVDNNLNPSDIELRFINVIDESKILEYRAFIVPATEVNSFSIEKADTISEENYLAIPTQGNNETVLRLPENLTQYNGISVQENEVYTIFLMTVSDMINNNVSTLNRFHYNLILSNPNLFYTGQRSGEYVIYNEYKTDKSIPAYHYFIDMDLDGDGVIDLNFEREGSGALGGGSHTTCLNLLNGTKVFCDTIPSTVSAIVNVPDHLPANIQLKANNLWQTGRFLMSHMLWSPSQYNHSGYWWNTQAKYLGIMIPQPSDTVYGWIYMSIGSSSEFFIYDYAVYDEHYGVETDVSHNNIYLYPNPSIGCFTIELENFTYPIDFEILDITGRIVYQGTAKSKFTFVNFQKNSSGVYLVRNSRDKSLIKKIIIE